MHKIFRLGGCMLARPQVCWAADIARVPLITARRPAYLHRAVTASGFRDGP